MTIPIERVPHPLFRAFHHRRGRCHVAPESLHHPVLHRADDECRERQPRGIRRFHENLIGQNFVLFTMPVAAAEAAVGLAIVTALYRNKQTLMIDLFNTRRDRLSDGDMVWLIPASRLPHSSSLCCSASGSSRTRPINFIFAMAGSFVLSCVALAQIWGKQEPAINLWQWFNVGNFQVPLVYISTSSRP